MATTHTQIHIHRQTDCNGTQSAQCNAINYAFRFCALCVSLLEIHLVPLFFALRKGRQVCCVSPSLSFSRSLCVRLACKHWQIIKLYGKVILIVIPIQLIAKCQQMFSSSPSSFSSVALAISISKAFELKPTDGLTDMTPMERV